MIWNKDESPWIKIRAGSIVEIPKYNEETDTFGTEVVRLTEDIGCVELKDGVHGEVIETIPAPSKVK